MPPLLKRLLLLPVLAPLVAVLALALLNPRPAVKLRLLTWSTPALPIGSWMAIAVGGGGLLSAAASAAALQTNGPQERRRVRIRGEEPSTAPPPRQVQPPERAAGAPPPTVEVPFRIIRRGSAGDRQPEPAQNNSQKAPIANAVGDGWDAVTSDDW